MLPLYRTETRSNESTSEKDHHVGVIVASYSRSTFSRRFTITSHCNTRLILTRSHAARRLLAGTTNTSNLTIRCTHVATRILSTLPDIHTVYHCNINCSAISITTTATHNVTIYGIPSCNARTISSRTITLTLTTTHSVPQLSQTLHTNHISFPNIHPRCLINSQIFNVIKLNHVKFTATHGTTNLNCHIIYRSVLTKRTSRFHNCPRIKLSRLLDHDRIISLRAPLARLARRLVNTTRLTTVHPSTVLIGATHNPIISATTLISTLATNTVQTTTLSITRARPLPPNRQLVSFPRYVLAPRVT